MKHALLFLTVLLCNAYFMAMHSQIKLPKLVSNGMVLQRMDQTNIWGWASEKEPVSIKFMGETYNTLADEAGKWSVCFEDLEAGGPYDMQIEGSTNSIHLKNIYVGDVWLASGQSNMELTMGRASPLYPEEIANASNEAIRFFEVPKTYDFENPRQELEDGEWKPVSPETIKQLSAVAYFFSKNLYEEYKVPIGIINPALGGSPAEAWISADNLKAFPEHWQEAQKFKDPAHIDSIESADQMRMHKWYSESAEKDTGIKEHWKAGELDDTAWHSMNIPGFWADTQLGPKNGVLWFRKQIQLSEAWTQEPVKLLLGRIVDADSVFVNGSFVGNTTYQYPPRRYEIPVGILKPGENNISVRVVSESGSGGFVPDKEYKLISKQGELELTGPWKFKLGVEMPRLQGQTFVRMKPTGLYNAMIHPLSKYNIKGIIWYQGESNTDDPVEYQELFPTLIRDWRNLWGKDDLPFLYVQLANFMETKTEPANSNWARLRDAQLKTLSVPYTGMAVAIDVGEWNDIHPLDKKTVGDRLARAAKAIAYNEDIIPSGPVYDTYRIEGDSIILSFKNVGSGLTSYNSDSLTHFAIAGKDRKFKWALARIDGNEITVHHPHVKDPVAVRYGWADNPEKANLYNREGLPASPFRTDDWE